MTTRTRKLLDKSFTAIAYSSLALMTAAVAVFLLPIIINGANAFIFDATVEHEKFLCENLDYDETASIRERIERSQAARAPLYEMFKKFEYSEYSTRIERSINNARTEALKKISQSGKEMMRIASLPRDKRKPAADAFAAEIWKDYLVEINDKVKSAHADGTSFSLAEILSLQKDSLSDLCKESIAKAGKFTFTQRNLLRRALTGGVIEELSAQKDILRRENAAYDTFKRGVSELLGPQTSAEKEALKLIRQKYGQPRMDLAREVFKNSIEQITVFKHDDNGNEISVRVNTQQFFKGSPVEKMFCYVKDNFEAMMQPHYTVYWGFFFDNPYDSNIFGGIWPMILGTFYLTVGAMLIAAPLGIIAAIYFAEYAKNNSFISFLRVCVGTLAGVPSIVFGLFGLAFLINTLRISESKSVLAGSITLALLILPTIIRSCEEALKSVPNSYREAALGLGAGKWKAICTVILPSALPAMLTGIIISMGRAAGETAPIIFTAATSTGAALAIGEIFTQATPALPWNIYNICSEHEMAERVAHVQYGMVLTLIAIVLSLNFAAIWLRARMHKRTRV